MTKCWWFGSCYNVSYNTDGTNNNNKEHIIQEEKATKLHNIPWRFPVFARFSSSFLDKKNKDFKINLKHGVGCVPHVHLLLV